MNNLHKMCLAANLSDFTELLAMGIDGINDLSGGATPICCVARACGARTRRTHRAAPRRTAPHRAAPRRTTPLHISPRRAARIHCHARARACLCPTP